MFGDAITLQVRPVLLPVNHQLASVRNENNAVLVRGDAVGEMLFCGKGAGSLPSASAVLSDVVDIACHPGGFMANPGGSLQVVTPNGTGSYHLRFPVADPSAIGAITTILERNGLPIARAAAVWAKSASSQNHVRVLTHACSRTALETSVSDVVSAGLTNKPVALPLL